MKCLLISRANNHTRSFPSPLQQAELDMASPIRLQHWLLSHNVSLFWPTLCWLILQTKLFVIIWHRVLVLNITNYSYLYKTRKGLCFVATGLLVIRLDWRPPRPPKLRGWVRCFCPLTCSIFCPVLWWFSCSHPQRCSHVCVWRSKHPTVVLPNGVTHVYLYSPWGSPTIYIYNKIAFLRIIVIITARTQ